jgi:ABC-2 type transport system permease protein
MGPLMRREFSTRRVSLVAYTLLSLGLVAVYVAVFPSIQAATAEFQQVLKAYPKEFFEAFNIQSLSFDTLEKYLAAEQYSLMWPLMGILLVLSRAGGSVAGEVERGTMGLLLALPVRRWQLVVAKYAAGWLALMIFATVSVLSVVPLAMVMGQQVDTGIAVRTWIIATLFLWAVFGAGMWLSTIFNERSRVYMVMGGGLLVMYVLNVVANLQPDWEWLRYGSVFYYFNAQAILTGTQLDWLGVAVFSGIIVATLGLAVRHFSRRDIAA